MYKEKVRKIRSSKVGTTCYMHTKGGSATRPLYVNSYLDQKLAPIRTIGECNTYYQTFNNFINLNKLSSLNLIKFWNNKIMYSKNYAMNIKTFLFPLIKGFLYKSIES